MSQGYTCLWRKIWNNAILAEPGKRFSRFEAWLYITNVLAAGMDDPASDLKRGEFVASVRFLAKTFNWSHAMAQRFIDQLLECSMIARVIRESIHPAIQEASRFIVCNYETYNSPRKTEETTDRYAERYKYKEGYKESIKKEKSSAFAKATADRSAYSKATADLPAIASAQAGVCVLGGRSFSEGCSPKILIEIYQQHNQSLPEVKALTSERLKKCRSRINQAVRDGCLEQYLADFASAVKKAQSTPFLRGEGVRGWRASFDWFVGNHVNVYAVLEGKYDTAFAKASACWLHGTSAQAGLSAVALAKAEGGNDHASFNGGGSRQPGRTSRGDLLYIPRQ